MSEVSERQAIDESLKKIKFVYRIAGFNFDGRNMTWRDVLIFWFNMLWMETDIFCAWIWMMYGIVNGGNFMELAYLSPSLIVGYMATIKTLYLIFYQKKIRELLNHLRNLEKTRLSENCKGQKIAMKETKFLWMVVNIVTVINFFVMMSFDVRPLLVTAVRYYKTGELQLLLPSVNIYPFDAFDIRYWPFAFVHELWTAQLVFVFLFAVDFLFYACCTHIKIQFKLLYNEMENLIPQPSSSKRQRGRNISEVTNIGKKLTDLLEWHQVIIRCAVLLEEIYSKSTLYNYVASSLMICLTGFNMMVNNDISIILTSGIMFVFGLGQVFTFCYFGDMLMNSSSLIATAAYNCNWYLADVIVRKMITIMQTRAQKPCKLTAGGFADVNLTAFMKILSTSWSYFALLKTMYGSMEVTTLDYIGNDGRRREL